MSQQAAKRRRAQARNGYSHLAKLGRPVYSKKNHGTVHDSVERERRKAARMAAAKRKKK